MSTDAQAPRDRAAASGRQHGHGHSFLIGSAGGPDDPSFVLLHGLGSNAFSFRPLMEALAPARILAWDAPGYGDSRPLDAAWPDAGDYARRLAGLTDPLGFPRFCLVGHSLGCLVAARFALRHPERVAALVLVSPALGYGTPSGEDLPEAVARRLSDLDALGPAGFAEARAHRFVADPSACPDVVAAVREAMAAVRRPGYDHAIRLLAGGRLLEDAAGIAVPVQVVCGRQDAITPVADAERLYAALPAAAARSLAIVDRAGHAVCQERPDAVADAIRDFLQAHAARR